MSRTFWCVIWSPTRDMNLPSAFTSTCCPAPGALWSIRPPYLKVVNISLLAPNISIILCLTTQLSHCVVCGNQSAASQWLTHNIWTCASHPSHLPSSHAASRSCEGDSDWSGHGAGFVEAARRAHRSGDTLHGAVRLQTGLDSWRMAGAA